MKMEQFFTNNDEDDVGCMRHVDGKKSPQNHTSARGEEIIPKMERGGSDSEYDTDLEETTIENEEQSSCRKIYIHVCRELKVVPCQSFLRQLDNEEVNISHYKIGPVGCEALARALMKNMNVFTLNLSDNAIGGQGAVYISKLLTENRCISCLDVSNNGLKTQGAYAVSEMMKENTHLLELNASTNNFIGKDIEPFVEALPENFTLKILNLSGNSFDALSGKLIGLAIRENVGLEVLDLSWNNIRGHGATAIGDALRVNYSLKILDLSWNGLADDGTAALSKALMVNDVLEVLDLSSNRLTARGAGDLAKALSVNASLKVLKVAQNSFSWNSALEIVKAAVDNADSRARAFYFGDMPVSEKFKNELDEIMLRYPDLTVQYGTIMRGKERVKEEKKRDLLNLLLEYIEMRGMRMLDMFKLLDRDNDSLVTQEDFVLGLKRTGLPMTREEIHRLITLLDRNNDGVISYQDFLQIRRKKVFDDFHSRKALKTKDGTVSKRKIGYPKK